MPNDLADYAVKRCTSSFGLKVEHINLWSVDHIEGHHDLILFASATSIKGRYIDPFAC